MGSTGIKSLLVISVILTTGLCQQQPVVEPNPITANQSFTVTCEANRVPAVPYNVTLIFLLKISRKVSANATDVAVAIYASFNPPGVNNSLQQSFIPPGRRWTITFTGSTNARGSPVYNRNAMKVVLEVSDTRLEDVGLYLCHVEYYLPSDARVFRADVLINVTAIASASPKTDPAKAGKNDAMIIVGIVIGCAVLIAIIICCVLRHKRSKRKQARSSVSREK